MDHLRLIVKRLLLVVTIWSFFSVASVVLAAENPWFVDIAFVTSELDDPIDRNLSSVFDTGITQVSLNSNGFDGDEAASLGIGYYVSSNWGVKLTWSQIDNFETLTLINIPEFFQVVLGNQEINIEGLTLRLLPSCI